MSALVVNDYLDFISLRNLLDITDGNLASHLKTLEKKGYVNYKKEFRGRKPHTRYMASKAGIAAFRRHIKAIEKLLG